VGFFEEDIPKNNDEIYHNYLEIQKFNYGVGISCIYSELCSQKDFVNKD